MKRWTILISLTAFLLSPLTSAFPAEMPSKIINVAVPAVSLLQAPLFVAIDAGAFKKYGMDVRYVLTGARTIQALAVRSSLLRAFPAGRFHPPLDRVRASGALRNLSRASRPLSGRAARHKSGFLIEQKRN
jgi:hypothetical protein